MQDLQPHVSTMSKKALDLRLEKVQTIDPRILYNIKSEKLNKKIDPK